MSTFGINDSLEDVVVSDPLNRDHPLARGLASFWLTLPALVGGSKFYDIVGYSNGTLTNGPTWTNSICGPTASFDGVDDYVLVTNPPIPTTGYTWAFTFYPFTASSSANGQPFILGLGNDTLGFSWNHGSSQFRLAAYHRDASTNYFAAKVNNGSANRWTRIVAAWDGSTLRAYQDGAAGATASPSSIQTASGNMVFGGSSTGNNNYVRCLIPNVTVWTRALSPAEVFLDYELAFTGFPGLLSRHSNSKSYFPSWTTGTVSSTNYKGSSGVTPNSVAAPSISASSWNPSNLSNVALWLDASDSSTLFQDSARTTAASSDSDPIGCWKDKSSNSRNATQTTANQKPILKLAALNSLPVIQWDGSNDYLANTTDIGLAQPNTILIVAKQTSGEGRFIDCDQANTNRQLFTINAGSGFAQSYAGTILQGSTDRRGSWGSWAIVFNGASSIIYRGGSVEAGSGNAGTKSFGAYVLGADRNASVFSNFLGGQIAEIVVCGSMTSPQLTAWFNYTSSKWGV